MHIHWMLLLESNSGLLRRMPAATHMTSRHLQVNN